MWFTDWQAVIWVMVSPKKLGVRECWEYMCYRLERILVVWIKLWKISKTLS